MIKPQHLKKGDKVAIVSLSNGFLGEPWAIHKLNIAKQRLERDFGLEVVVMPNALKGIKYLSEHPEKRAEDLMDAFKDTSIKAIFNAIGGTDTIRLLPYIDFDIIKSNPKIFTGFSDTTVNHFMMHHAGLVSYYGASIMNNFSEYVKINEYTLNAIKNILFNPTSNLEILPSTYESFKKDIVMWGEDNINKQRTFYPTQTGYEVLNGTTTVNGELLGGCIYTFINMLGTKIWPTIDDWRGKILMIELSDDDIPLEITKSILLNLNAQGIFDVINGIIVGKNPIEEQTEELKELLVKTIVNDCKHKDLPIVYNFNFGHAEPIGVFPLGISCKIDCSNKTLTLLESATK